MFYTGRLPFLLVNQSVEAVKRTQSTEANQGKQPMANGHPFLIHLLTPQERDIAAAFMVVPK